jgi:hypothetical protein
MLEQLIADMKARPRRRCVGRRGSGMSCGTWRRYPETGRGFARAAAVGRHSGPRLGADLDTSGKPDEALSQSVGLDRGVDAQDPGVAEVLIVGRLPTVTYYRKNRALFPVARCRR